MRGGTVSRIGRTASLAEAARLWRECQVIVPGSVAATYLEGRACALPHPDGDLRWHPTLPYPLSGRTFPALVAKVTDAITGEGLTVHRTWMAADGSGKAPVEKPRLLWPGLPKAGGVVRLWPDEEVSTGLLIGEGIETCLSAALAFTPVWSALDAGNLGSLPVLEGIETLTVVADHDQVGIAAAEECARRWDAAGAEVRLWLPPDEGTDLNDFVREDAP
jgi:hypothetical protein